MKKQTDKYLRGNVFHAEISNHDSQTKIKNNIKLQGTIKNLTQEQLAHLANVSRQTIMAIKKEKYVPSTVLSLKIASIFEKPVNEIFKLEDGDWQSKTLE